MALLLIATIFIAFFAGRYCGGFASWMRASLFSCALQVFLVALIPALVWIRAGDTEASLLVFGIGAISYMAGAVMEDWVNYGDIRLRTCYVLERLARSAHGRMIDPPVSTRPGYTPGSRPITGRDYDEFQQMRHVD